MQRGIEIFVTSLTKFKKVCVAIRVVGNADRTYLLFFVFNMKLHLKMIEKSMKTVGMYVNLLYCKEGLL